MSRLRPAANVGSLELGEMVYAAPLPEGPIVVLDGGAAAIWLAACTGPRETIAERVASMTGATVTEVGRYAEAFVDELLQRKLLVADADD
jgi:hypothetical protein